MKKNYKFIPFGIFGMFMFLFCATSANAASSTLYGLGTAFDQWDSNSGISISESEVSGIFVFEKELSYNGDNKQFKFTLSQGNWDAVDYFIPSVVDYNGNVQLISDAGEYDMTICSQTAGNLEDHFWGINALTNGIYRITVNTNTNKLSVELMESKSSPLYIVGDAALCGWDPQAAFELYQNGNIYTYTGYFNQDNEFKFLTTHDWGKLELRNGNADASTNEYLDLTAGGALALKSGDNEDYKFKLAESGNYKITCDIDAMTLNAEKITYQDAQIKYPALYLVGDATPGGWSTSAATPLWRQDNEANMFTYSGKVQLTAGNFKITVAPGKGFDNSYFYFKDASDEGKISTDATDDRQWTITETGDYTVTIDLNAMTISTVKDVSTAYNPTDDFPGVTIQSVDKTINISNASGTTFYLYSVQGELLKKMLINTSLQQLSADHLNAGIYIARLSKEGKTKTYKLLLK
ncbi:MAG: SusF/SusE family outer membrane protein [Paludibacter sp.]|nr:SusF/SusE family outer membrane protein [Paludibacter sp.]